MIVARISQGNANSAKGSVTLDGYDEWFPLSDVSFSFSFGTSRKEPDYKTIASLNTEKEVRAALVGTTALESSKSENSVSCSKYVDVSTSALMYLSVSEKFKVKIARTLTAEIHFLESVSTFSKEPNNSNHGMTAYMKVALADVVVDSWSLSGSGDERATETFSLLFDKLAIHYAELEENGILKPSTAKGFSQKDLVEWLPDKWKEWRVK